MKTVKDINYDKLQKQTLDLYLPEEQNFKTFVFFHGGGLDGGDKIRFSPVAKYLTDKNIAVISANYRMYPDALYPDFIEDAAKVTAWAFSNMKNYGGNGEIYVGGESAGAYISMMLCFDKRWLNPYQIAPTDIKGYVHAAGQPTCHFRVLSEYGIDSRRVIIDERAPIFHIGTSEYYSPMAILVSDADMENRYEQIILMISTMKHFGYDMEKVTFRVIHGKHCQYIYILLTKIKIANLVKLSMNL